VKRCSHVKTILGRELTWSFFEKPIFAAALSVGSLCSPVRTVLIHGEAARIAVPAPTRCSVVADQWPTVGKRFCVWTSVGRVALFKANAGFNLGVTWGGHGIRDRCIPARNGGLMGIADLACQQTPDALGRCDCAPTDELNSVSKPGDWRTICARQEPCFTSGHGPPSQVKHRL